MTDPRPPVHAPDLGEDPEARRTQALTLAATATASDLPLLIAFLSDESWRVRKAAVAGFRRLPADQAAPVLLASLADEANAGLRNSALEALQEFGEAAVQHLHRALKMVDSDTRLALLGLLGQIAHPDSVPYILYYLGSADRNAVAAAVAALGEIRDPSATEVLVKLLSGADDWLATQVIEALGEIGDAAALGGLIAAAGAPGPRRRAAWAALGRIGGREAQTALLSALQEERFPVEALVALVMLHGRLMRRASSQALAARLRDEIQAVYPATRNDELARVIGRATSPTRGSLARFALWTRRPELLPAALMGLAPGDLRDEDLAALAQIPQSGETLLAAFTGALETERQLALAPALGRLAPAGTEAVLMNALSGADPLLREAALSALTEAGGPSALTAISENALDEPGLLPAAIAACHAILSRHPQATPVLREFLVQRLGDADPGARLATIRLAGALAPAALAEARDHLLRDAAAPVRAATLEAAGPGVLPAEVLRRMLLDEAPAVRRQALRLLRHEGLTTPVLDQALADPDLWLRADAAATLAVTGEAEQARGFALLGEWPEPVAAAFLGGLAPASVRTHEAALTAVARDPRGEVARAAVAALAHCRLASAEPFLRDWLAAAHTARVLAALELSSAPEFAGLQALALRRLDRLQEPAVRRLAFAALAGMQMPEAIPMALRLLEDEVAGEAALAYLRAMKRFHPQLLRQAAAAGSPRVRSVVRELLGESA